MSRPDGAKAWEAPVKEGGDNLRQGVMIYKVQCRLLGRGKQRPPFDWAGFRMSVDSVSKQSTGRKMTLVTKGQCCKRWAIDNFFDFLKKRLRCEQASLEHLDRVDPKLVMPRKTRVWSVPEEFLVQENSKVQEEVLNHGHKQIKNPSAQTLNRILQGFGKDHQKMDSMANYGKHLNMNQAQLDALGQGLFPEPSATGGQKKEWEQDEAEQEKLKQERKAKAMKRLKNKPFDENGVRSIMEASQGELAQKLKTAAVSLQDDCEALMQQIEVDASIKAKMATAVNVLKKSSRC